MNGRIYDPIIHQMTGPDILDANPYSTQAYNRYAYVMNNPMKYVDPSGFWSEKGYKGEAGTWDPNIDYSYYSQMAKYTEYGYLHDDFDDMEMLMMLLGWNNRKIVGGLIDANSLLSIIDLMNGKKRDEIATNLVLTSIQKMAKWYAEDDAEFRVDFNILPFTHNIIMRDYYSVLGHDFTVTLSSNKSSNFVNRVYFSSENPDRTEITFEHLGDKHWIIGILHFNSHQDAENFYNKYMEQ